MTEDSKDEESVERYEAEESKGQKYLDRYEVVAVALPGAVALLFLWYLHPEILGTTKFELKDISVGTLGIFAIVSLAAGQVVQAMANLSESFLTWLADHCLPNPAENLLSDHQWQKFDRTMERKTGVDNASKIAKAKNRRCYRKDLLKDIIDIARRRDTTGMLQIFSVTYGLNRGLAIAAGAAAAGAAIEARWPTAVVFVLLCIAMTYRAVRFSRRYEGELLRRVSDGPEVNPTFVAPAAILPGVKPPVIRSRQTSAPRT
jgi:hypothetical protein